MTIAASNALKISLLNNPLNTLQTNPLQVGLRPGHASVVQAEPFANVGNAIAVGPAVAASQSRINVNAIITPTRARNDPNRFAALQRFGAGVAADFWFTERQTGCSLIILDWGGGNFSMAHLAPFAMSSYSQIAKAIFNNAPLFVFAESQRAFLKKEVTQVVDASKLGAINPARYILVQSNHAAINLKSINVVGVKNAIGNWKFFMQTIGQSTNSISAVKLKWTNWQSHVPYFTY